MMIGCMFAWKPAGFSDKELHCWEKISCDGWMGLITYDTHILHSLCYSVEFWRRFVSDGIFGFVKSVRMG